MANANRVLRRGWVTVAVLWSLQAMAQGELSDLDQGRNFHRDGNFPAARTAYQRVLDDPLATVSDQAAAGTNLSLLLLTTGHPDEAVEIGHRAVGLRRQLDDPARLARTLNNLGLALQRTGAFTDARKAFDEAVDLNRGRGDSSATALNLGNIAALEIEAGHYESALDVLDQTDAITASNSEPWSREQIAMTHLNRGVVLERLGDHLGALEQLELAGRDDSLPPDQVAAFEINLGVVLRHLGDPVKATAAFERAGASFQRSADPAGVSSAALNTALALHHDLEDFDAAQREYQRALALALESADKTQQISVRLYFGEFLADRGLLGAAEDQHQQCLELAESVGIAEGRWSALAGLGRIAELRGDLELAAVFLRRSVTEIEALRGDLTSRSLRTSYLQEQRPIYESAVRVFVALAEANPENDWLQRAFEIVQRAKARELSEALEVSPEDPKTPIDLERALDGRTLLSYFVAGNQLIRFDVAGGQLSVTVHDDWQSIDADVDEIRAHLSQQREPQRAVIEQLSAALVDNLGGSGGRGFVIAPDQTLHGLPFEILETRPGSQLLDAGVVSYVPAASFLANGHDRHRNSSERTIAFANPVSTDEGSARRRRFLADFSLPQLPRAPRELAAISTNLAGPHRHFEGEMATESTFRRVIGEPSSVLHLATHAIADESRRNRTAVILGSGPDHDGILYPAEVATLEIPSDLTVLAACHTASELGSVAGAHASLVGSFLMAGSASVIATLWDVSDADSSVFMEQFYFQLGRGLPGDEALREVKLRLRASSEWGNPGIWSAFVLVGKSPPTRSNGAFEMGFGLVFLLAVVTIVAFVRRRWRPSFQ